jgi:20S proteasome subunit beta 4
MRGPTVLKVQDDKTRSLNKHTLMAYSKRNGSELSPYEVSSFVRSSLAKSLRSKNPYNVNLLLGGFDPITDKPELYWIDYLASSARVPYAAHGYAQYYCLSLLDKHHHPDIDFEQGMKILRMCTDELKRRLPIDFKGVLVKVVTKDGIRVEPYLDEKPVYAP